MNSVFSCCYNLLSSWLERVTIDTYNFVSVIASDAPVGELSKTAGLSPCAAVVFC